MAARDSAPCCIHAANPRFGSVVDHSLGLLGRDDDQDAIHRLGQLVEAADGRVALDERRARVDGMESPAARSQLPIGHVAELAPAL